MIAWKRRVLGGLAACCLLVMSACDKSSSSTGNNSLPSGGGNEVKIDGYDVGQRAFEIEGKAIADGAAIQLSEYKGKVVLLDFWATWCGPCVAAIPHEKELVARYRDRPFTLIGISNDKTADDLTKFLSKNSLPWPNVFDADENIARKWNVRSWPTFVLIDHEGRVVGRWIGANLPEIEKAIERELQLIERR